MSYESPTRTWEAGDIDLMLEVLPVIEARGF